MRTVIITGGAGFIGSHLCDRFLAVGDRVLAVDNLLTGSKANVEHITSPNFQFIEGDINQPIDTYLPLNVIPDLVLHFASPASPPKYQAHPIETYLVNSYATHTLLQYLLQKNPKAKFLFASTSEVYGDPLTHPQKESDWGNVNPNGLRSCYDEAKRLGETICGVHARTHNMDVRILRIFNTYGPRMDLNDGRIIPNLIREAMAHEPLTIYGTGEQTRSYCYVDDLVEGIVRYAEKDGLQGQTLNLGNPGEYTVLETAKEILKIINGENTEHPSLSFLPLPKDDPTRRRPDISKAKQVLSWEPSVSFSDGLKKTIEYFKNLA